MFTVTENAHKELIDFFHDRDACMLRIYLGWRGESPKLVLAFEDSTHPNDKVFSVYGYDFCIDADLLKLTSDVVVDADENGFYVKSLNALQGVAMKSFCCGGGCAGCSRFSGASH